MKNSRVSEVRIVKCPKCTKLLPEPADAPFYICGGCNTTLQAKYYKKTDQRRNTVSGGSGSIKINEDDSVNEPGHLKVKKPSKSLINTGEGPGDHGSVGKHEDGKASSSNEPNEQVRQDEIVLEEELLSANSSSEDASSETNTTKSEEKALSNQEAGELNQNDEVCSCRKEQDEVASSSREVLLSSENSRRKTTVHEPRVGDKKLTSQSGSPDGETTTQNIPANHKEQPGFGVKHESAVSSGDEHVFKDGSSSQFLGSKQFEGVSSKIVTSSNDSILIKDRQPHHSTTEIKERGEASIQNGVIECEDNKNLDSHPNEINSSFRINSEKMDESASLIPEAAQRAGSDPSSKPDVSTPSGQDGKWESEQSFEADAPSYGNTRVPAVKAIPMEKMADLRQTVDRFESKPSSKVTETAAISAKSPTRNSFTSEGSVSSCDGNDNKPINPIASKNITKDKTHQHSSAASKTCSSPTLQRQTDDLQTVSGSDSFHSAAQSIPPTFREFKTPRGFSNSSHTRTMTGPRTGQVFPRPSLYRRSPDTSYEYEEIYDHPVRHPPYISRDTESRITRRFYTDPIWTKEELPVCPYHESNERLQICCQGARRAAYRPLTHSMAQIPYSGETVRSSYDHRSRYIPREPFDSYADSDYYEDQIQRDHDISRLRSRRRSQPLRHFQPVVGAAPFVTCYKCSELLQLPSDFLVFRGVRRHRVKCSACSTILKYSLERGRHLAPYSSRKNGADVALQRCASACSYAVDSEKMSLQSSSGKHCRDKDKGKGVVDEGGGGPRVTWKRPSRTSPPLHQLMGYSSLSAALDGRALEDREMVAESMN